jgi:hypothetical protein
MFYINEKLLTPEAPQWPAFKKWCDEEWDKFPERVIFKDGKSRMINPYRNQPEQKASTHHQLAATVRTTLGTETWNYSSSYAIKKPNGRLAFSDDRLAFFAFHIIPKENKEMLYFFLTKFKPVLKGEIWMENKEAEALKDVEKEAVKSEVSYLINSKKSRLNEKNIRVVAMSWNIANSNDLSISEVRKALFAAIESREVKTKDGYSKFLEQAENLDSKFVYVSSLIRETLDKKVIIFNSAKQRIEYTANMPENQKEIYHFLPNDLNNWFEAFGVFLNAHDDLVSYLEDALDLEPTDDIQTANDKQPKKVGFQKGHKLNLKKE